MACWQTGLGMILGAALAAGQHGSSTTVNPYTGPAHAAAGAALYRGKCAGCHGPDGRGSGAGPALHTGKFQRGGTDEGLFQTISKGVPGTSMPAFAMTGLETWQVITHLRTLSVAGRVGAVSGDAAAGEKLFASYCQGCHTTGTTGGFLGPDLSDLASRRSAEELRRSILEPDAAVPSEYWSAVVRTKDGATLRGTRLNEDTHSLQLRDAQGRLVSVDKGKMAEMELVRRSPMPAFAGKLSPSEVDNLISYLARSAGGAR